MRSWKTTAAGIAAAIAAAASAVSKLLDADPMTNPDWAVVGAALMAAFGLFVARDNDKRSEDVGAG